MTLQLLKPGPYDTAGQSIAGRWDTGQIRDADDLADEIDREIIHARNEERRYAADEFEAKWLSRERRLPWWLRNFVVPFSATAFGVTVANILTIFAITGKLMGVTP